MRHVAGGHQEVGATDGGQTIFLLRRPIDRHALANHVVVADLDPGVAAAVADILRLATDHAVGEDSVSLANPHRAHDGDVVGQHAPPANLSPRGDYAVGTDPHVIGEVSTHLDNGRRVDLGRTAHHAGDRHRLVFTTIRVTHARQAEARLPEVATSRDASAALSR